MSRRRAPNPSGVNLFPFLAVLVSTMGALILLLLVISRQAQRQRDLAAQPQSAVPVLKPLPELRNDFPPIEPPSPEPSRWQAPALPPLARLDGDPDQLRRQRDALQSELIALGSVISDEDLTADLQRIAHRQAELQAELADAHDRRQVEIQRMRQLQTELDKKQLELQQARLRSKGINNKFAVIPYTGPNGTARRPIYLECRSDHIVLQPDGIRFEPWMLAAATDPGNPLSAVVRSLAAEIGYANPSGLPYPLLLVRPDGIAAFYQARAALERVRLPIGYELIDDAIELAYPPSEPHLRKIAEDAMRLAVEKQRPDSGGSGYAWNIGGAGGDSRHGRSEESENAAGENDSGEPVASASSDGSFGEKKSPQPGNGKFGHGDGDGTPENGPMDAEGRHAEAATEAGAGIVAQGTGETTGEIGPGGNADDDAAGPGLAGSNRGNDAAVPDASIDRDQALFASGPAARLRAEDLVRPPESSPRSAPRPFPLAHSNSSQRVGRTLSPGLSPADSMGGFGLDRRASSPQSAPSPKSAFGANDTFADRGPGGGSATDAGGNDGLASNSSLGSPTPSAGSSHGTDALGGDPSVGWTRSGSGGSPSTNSDSTAKGDSGGVPGEENPFSSDSPPPSSTPPAGQAGAMGGANGQSPPSDPQSQPGMIGLSMSVGQEPPPKTFDDLISRNHRSPVDKFLHEDEWTMLEEQVALGGHENNEFNLNRRAIRRYIPAECRGDGLLLYPSRKFVPIDQNTSMESVRRELYEHARMQLYVWEKPGTFIRWRPTYRLMVHPDGFATLYRLKLELRDDKLPIEYFVIEENSGLSPMEP